MFAGIPGKGITLEMYIRNTKVNKKKKNKSVGPHLEPLNWYWANYRKRKIR